MADDGCFSSHELSILQKLSKSQGIPKDFEHFKKHICQLLGSNISEEDPAITKVFILLEEEFKLFHSQKPYKKSKTENSVSVSKDKNFFLRESKQKSKTRVKYTKEQLQVKRLLKRHNLLKIPVDAGSSHNIKANEPQPKIASTSSDQPCTKTPVSKTCSLLLKSDIINLTKRATKKLRNESQAEANNNFRNQIQLGLESKNSHHTNIHPLPSTLAETCQRERNRTTSIQCKQEIRTSSDAYNIPTTASNLKTQNQSNNSHNQQDVSRPSSAHYASVTHDHHANSTWMSPIVGYIKEEPDFDQWNTAEIQRKPTTANANNNKSSVSVKTEPHIENESGPKQPREAVSTREFSFLTKMTLSGVPFSTTTSYNVAPPSNFKTPPVWNPLISSSTTFSPNTDNFVIPILRSNNDNRKSTEVHYIDPFAHSTVPQQSTRSSHWNHELGDKLTPVTKSTSSVNNADVNRVNSTYDKDHSHKEFNDIHNSFYLDPQTSSGICRNVDLGGTSCSSEKQYGQGSTSIPASQVDIQESSPISSPPAVPYTINKFGDVDERVNLTLLYRKLQEKVLNELGTISESNTESHAPKKRKNCSDEFDALVQFNNAPVFLKCKEFKAFAKADNNTTAQKSQDLEVFSQPDETIRQKSQYELEGLAQPYDTINQTSQEPKSLIHPKQTKEIPKKSKKLETLKARKKTKLSKKSKVLESYNAAIPKKSKKIEPLTLCNNAKLSKKGKNLEAFVLSYNPAMPQRSKKIRTLTQPNNATVPQKSKKLGTLTQPNNATVPQKSKKLGTLTQPNNATVPQKSKNLGTLTQPNNATVPQKSKKLGTLTQPNNTTVPQKSKKLGTLTQPNDATVPLRSQKLQTLPESNNSTIPQKSEDWKRKVRRGNNIGNIPQATNTPVSDKNSTTALYWQGHQWDDDVGNTPGTQNIEIKTHFQSFFWEDISFPESNDFRFLVQPNNAEGSLAARKMSGKPEIFSSSTINLEDCVASEQSSSLKNGTRTVSLSNRNTPRTACTNNDSSSACDQSRSVASDTDGECIILNEVPSKDLPFQSNVPIKILTKRQKKNKQKKINKLKNKILKHWCK